jgi:hypothetical protein
VFLLLQLLSKCLKVENMIFSPIQFNVYGGLWLREDKTRKDSLDLTGG